MRAECAGGWQPSSPIASADPPPTSASCSHRTLVSCCDRLSSPAISPRVWLSAWPWQPPERGVQLKCPASPKEVEGRDSSKLASAEGETPGLTMASGARGERGRLRPSSREYPGTRRAVKGPCRPTQSPPNRRRRRIREGESVAAHARVRHVTCHSAAGGRETRARPGSITTNAPVMRSPSSATTLTTASPRRLRASFGKRIRRTPAVS